jgi:hypothetical protein
MEASMPSIPVGLSSKAAIVVAILALLPPFITQIVALVENVSVHWTGADKTSLIIGAVTTLGLIVMRGAQAVAAILSQKTEAGPPKLP